MKTSIFKSISLAAVSLWILLKVCLTNIVGYAPGLQDWAPIWNLHADGCLQLRLKYFWWWKCTQYRHRLLSSWHTCCWNHCRPPPWGLRLYHWYSWAFTHNDYFTICVIRCICLPIDIIPLTVDIAYSLGIGTHWKIITCVVHGGYLFLTGTTLERSSTRSPDRFLQDWRYSTWFDGNRHWPSSRPHSSGWGKLLHITLCH